MTEFNRQVVLEKINQLLEKKLTPAQVYEWVLGLVVAKSYDKFAAEDPLVERAVKVLMDANEDHKITAHELELLQYYRECLSGQREFVPIGEDFVFPEIPREILEKWSVDPEQEQEELTWHGKVMHWLRVYVYIFAVYVLLSSIWDLLQLGGPWASKRIKAMITYPFFIYGGLLILPMQTLVVGKFFIATLLLSILAAAYFWFDFFQLFFSADFNFLSIFIKLILGAIPSLLAVWLLVHEKYIKNRKVVKEE